MFFELFDWFLSSLVQIFEMFKRIEFFPGFSLFSLGIALGSVTILGFLLSFILGKDSD